MVGQGLTEPLWPRKRRRSLCGKGRRSWGLGSCGIRLVGSLMKGLRLQASHHS